MSSRLLFSDHAVDRLARRAPHVDVARAKGEILDGIRRGRVSTARPDWLDGDHDADGARYVWTRRDGRCYVLQCSRRPGDRTWWVVTVLVNVLGEAAA